jgi:ATPase family AAA domain-containing protein 3A/B
MFLVTRIPSTSKHFSLPLLQAVAAAKAEAERANEDVHLRRLQAESEQRQKRNIAAIQTIFANLATAFTAAADNPAKVLTFIGYITLFFAAVYTAREAARLCRILLEAALGKPKLVRETTRMSLPRTLLNNLLFLGRRANINTNKTVEETFQDLILPGPLKSRVLTIAKSVRNAHRNKAPHRHMLLYGPPGTGKTLVAKTIAECVGMDYALMSGGDVGPLGSDAVTQIHSLFSWAKMSPKGVLLFVDEAEAFLGSRSKYTMSECAHNALNAILYNTGSERRDFMLILATNR